ncbi:ribonuclease domain-containing protein [Lysobacter enzymogenes]|uniref:Guanyl-specific ribonuclease Sa3 (RNase Sa3) n=1 Tax=Lysobacter enzymogenes TaxID=69 RepID=A0A0S2DAL3_LYSEN|nr:ribonuclease domain-containing protein [Lysobacter enzymogenes]ALN55437.1 guanyl-specific ribonuclease Sa3 (RNase Sa3) [Lysobacter enzymogenes]QCW24514.1 ribonuclease [Lysobacter enzymogenes]QQQ01247.1 ribonuclease [Lysobacter enzymogenes]
MRRPLWLIPVVALLALWLWSQQGARQPTGDSGASAPVAVSAGDGLATSAPAFLPAEARDVLRRIADGGPFAHRQDGSTFQNRERRLPAQARGYYREYTVETPGSGDRGARRIVTGGDPPSEYYYTDDHYRSFRRFDPPAQGAAR